jgi:hypothetical protein
MKRTSAGQLLNAIVIILLGLWVIWAASPGMSAPSLQGGGTVTPTIHAQLMTTLVASDAATSDSFGYSIGISGDTIVVGSPYDNHSSLADPGSAYVYVRDGNSWTQQAQLIATDAFARQHFGYSVAISGDTIVVSSNDGDNPPPVSPKAGAAYVFVRSGTTWSQQQKLTPSSSTDLTTFGWSVSIHNDTIVVGAPFEDVLISTNDGAAYVFVRSGTTWSQQQRLTITEERLLLGYSVDIYGDTIVVGAPNDFSSVFIFHREGTTWTQQQKVTPGTFLSSLGFAVAVYEDRIIMGAPGTAMGDDQVYVYRWTGTTWELEGNGGPQSSSGYAWSVDIYQNVGIVGQIYATATSTTIPPEGAVHMITINDDGSINTLNTFQAMNPLPNDSFGRSVGRDGWTIVISAPYRDFSGLTNAGAVYVYDVNGPPWRTATPGPSTTISENEFFEALETARTNYPDILTIVPDFVSGAINMTVSVSGGVVGNMQAQVTQEQGFVSFSFTNITVDGTPAPTNYVTIINRDLPTILTTALDNLVTARFGSLLNIQSITVTNEALILGS